MPSPLEKLNIDKELACRFLAEFSRFEFAFKATKFATLRKNGVVPDWEKFGASIQGAFASIDDPNFIEASKYLKNFPPMKQTLKDEKLTWILVPQTKSTEEEILQSVRRVRNNLFHGGKYYLQSDPDRDRLLVEHSSIVLAFCLILDYVVKDAYENY